MLSYLNDVCHLFIYLCIYLFIYEIRSKWSLDIFFCSPLLLGELKDELCSILQKKSCLQSYNQIRLCLTLSGIRYMIGLHWFKKYMVVQDYYKAKIAWKVLYCIGNRSDFYSVDVLFACTKCARVMQWLIYVTYVSLLLPIASLGDNRLPRATWSCGKALGYLWQPGHVTIFWLPRHPCHKHWVRWIKQVIWQKCVGCPG